MLYTPSSLEKEKYASIHNQMFYISLNVTIAVKRRLHVLNSNKSRFIINVICTTTLTLCINKDHFLGDILSKIIVLRCLFTMK